MNNEASNDHPEAIAYKHSKLRENCKLIGFVAIVFSVPTISLIIYFSTGYSIFNALFR